jgi:hypothetical protein
VAFRHQFAFDEQISILSAFLQAKYVFLLRSTCASKDPLIQRIDGAGAV